MKIVCLPCTIIEDITSELESNVGWEGRVSVSIIHIGINSIDRARKAVLLKEFEQSENKLKGRMSKVIISGLLTEPLAKIMSFNLRAFRWAQLMIFAIEEINNDPLLLPNITLGYKIYDSCTTPVLALRAALTILNGQDENVTLLKCHGGSSVHALIADAGSTQSIAIARTVGIFGIPMVSYFSSCTCLSNKKQFPTFFRTVPSDYFQVTAFVQLVKHFGWTWLAVFGSNDDYGHLGILTFVEQVTKVGVCVAFSDFLPKVYDREKILHPVKLIKSLNVKVILAFVPEIDLSFLMEELVRQNVTGGTLGWAIRRAYTPGMKQFLVRLHPPKYPGNVYIKQFWEAVFHCTWTPYNNTEEIRMGPSKQKCPGQENLKDVRTIFTDESQLRVSYNTYRAVYAVAHSIHNLMLCKKGQGPFINKAHPDISNLKSWQVLHYLKEVNFTTTLGDEVRFNANGDPLAAYDLLNWQVDSNGNIKYVKVGQYIASAETENQLVIQEDAIIWNGGQKMVGRQVVKMTQRVFEGCRHVKSASKSWSCEVLMR
ncbi:vomeronasal type-2 receptor 1-like [Chiloscyllium punctatum]|uniref:vomeronasal type-2 receptor 1-like n=1 Tax=Chiloscyllium punctatum TaxID=137246 RepID=UPI003B636AA7